MVDILVDKFVEGFLYELGPSSPFYTDYLVEHITNKGITPDSPNLSIGVLEGDAEPIEFEIAKRQSNTKERYNIQIQIIVKSAQEQEAKAVRRILTQRIKHALYRGGGADTTVFKRILTSQDEDTGYVERPQKYGIIRTLYDNGDGGGMFVYMASLDIFAETEVDYTN